MLTQQAGQAAENSALHYLNQKGLKLVVRNFSCRTGEIDLIMRDANYLVFIEVRSRSHVSYGGGLASINSSKKNKILKTAQFYMMKFKIQDSFPMRFDVISIDGNSGQITWVKDAFGADY